MKIKHILLVFLWGLLSPIFAQKVAGFFPDWVASSKVNEVQYDKLTDVYFAFMKPATNGTLSTTTSGSESKILAPLATKCQQNDVKIHISVGGANHSGNFSTVVGNQNNRTNFVNSAASFITEYNLDGINIDWEFPSASHATNLALLMKELRAKLDELEGTMGKKLELSAAVAPLLWNSDGINADFLAYCDFVHVMAFDSGGNCCVCSGNQHSSYETAVRALQKWTTGLASSCGGNPAGKNIDPSKIVLAIPFYSGSPYVGYNSFSGNNPEQYYNDEDGIVGSYDFNSRPMIEKKVKLIMEDYKGAGVWAWELSQDRSDEYSLLKVMWDNMQPYMKKCEITEPNLGDDMSICGTSSVKLTSNVPTDGKLTYTWFKDNKQIKSNKTGTNHNATEAGEYKVVVSNGECEKESEVNVLGILPNVDLGSAITLCDPVEAILDAKVQGSGIAYTWKRNTQIIDNATGKTITVTESGTYQVTISAENCASKSDEIEVTSALLPVEGDEVCKGEIGTLKVLENNGPYEWFTSPTATNSIAEGKEYIVDNTQSTTYYVQKKETFLEKVVGPQGDSKFTINKTLSHFNYQKIEVESELTLKKVTYKAGAQGSYSKIELLNENKQKIDESIAKQYAAHEEIVVNFDKVLLPGTYYFHSQQWGGSVQYNTTKATYSETGVMKIHPEEDYNATTTGTYGFLYDVTVKAGFKNTCAKTPVNLIVNQDCQSNSNPEVLITSPTTGDKIVVDTNIDIKANVSDAEGDLLKVEVLIKDEITGIDIEKLVFNDVQSQAFTTNYTFNQSGTYMIQVSVTDTKGAVSVDQVLVTVSKITTTVVESILQSDLLVYPNPATQLITVEYNVSKEGDTQVILLDILGNEIQEIVNNDMSIGHYTQQINVQELPAGIYVVQVTNSTGTVTKRLIIE